MAGDRVTVFGGSGFLGRRVAARLAADGWEIRAAVRRPEAVSLSGEAPIEPLKADVRDAAAVARAVAGAKAVVNAVGLYVERGAASFEAVHAEGAETVAAEAAAAGAERLVHLSGIGADPGSESLYVRTRAEGERRVLAAFPGAMIFRPSLMFGRGDAFFATMATLSRLSPVLPLFGGGRTRLQPVYVEDVAAAVAVVLKAPAPKPGLYELGGPKVYSYRELTELALKGLGRRRLLLPLPFALAEMLAALLAPLPSPPLTRDQLALMKRDNLVGAGVLTFADLGLTPVSVESVLPEIVG